MLKATSIQIASAFYCISFCLIIYVYITALCALHSLAIWSS
jgi:hypothetical protein